MKKVFSILFLFLFIFTTVIFSQTTTLKSTDTVENYIFRLKLCQLSSYGAKIIYYSYTGYPKVCYVPIKFLNEIVFIKVDPNVPYPFVQVIIVNKKIVRITVYLTNIMVPEYSTADLSDHDIEMIQKTTDITITF
ncbi:MAG: hypothetical protein NUV32_00115 [Exilispira sp.]|jgi:hypothetical protein|nr:hypothetical protein [Exilispira sp.]